MCGIVGAVSQRNIVPVLIEGLRRLEYRGYDSCGVAVHADGGLKRARSVARVAELDAQANDLAAFTGIAHTRWATHARGCKRRFTNDLRRVGGNSIFDNDEPGRDADGKSQ